MMGRGRLLMVLCIVPVLLLAACVPLPPPAASPGTVPATAPNATPTRVPPPATPPAAATVVSLATPQAQGSFASPDGRWRAEIVVYPCVETGEGQMAFEELRLTDLNLGTTDAVDFQLRNCGGLGAFGLGGLFWSPNSRYFYYTDAREGQPDGGCGPWIPPTVRLDPATRDVVRMGNGPLSPDQTRLATWQDPFVTVWDLEAGDPERVNARVEGLFPGAIAWSPDGTSLAYLQTASICPPTGASHVTLVHIADLSQEALLDADPPGFTGLAWEDGSALRLTSSDGKEWLLDVDSRELKPVE